MGNLRRMEEESHSPEARGRSPRRSRSRSPRRSAGVPDRIRSRSPSPPTSRCAYCAQSEQEKDTLREEIRQLRGANKILKARLSQQSEATRSLPHKPMQMIGELRGRCGLLGASLSNVNGHISFVNVAGSEKHYRLLLVSGQTDVNQLDILNLVQRGHVGERFSFRTQEVRTVYPLTEVSELVGRHLYQSGVDESSPLNEQKPSIPTIDQFREAVRKTLLSMTRGYPVNSVTYEPYKTEDHPLGTPVTFLEDDAQNGRTECTSATDMCNYMLGDHEPSSNDEAEKFGVIIHRDGLTHDLMCMLAYPGCLLLECGEKHKRKLVIRFLCEAWEETENGNLLCHMIRAVPIYPSDTWKYAFERTGTDTPATGGSMPAHIRPVD